MTTIYEMEELVPVVAGLAERYTSGESTSITYEKAQQLMEAVLYCIHELEQDGLAKNSVSAGKTTGKMPAQQAYCLGLSCVKKKTEETLRQYNELLTDFVFFENRCLYDTFVKGFPQFFKWYNMEYNPQNTILTLDYPVLRDLSSCTGIDKIAAYTDCIRLEQLFLKSFPQECIRNILASYNKSYLTMVENICEPVAGAVVCSLLTGRPLAGKKTEKGDFITNEKFFAEEDFLRIRQLFGENQPEDIAEPLQIIFKRFLTDYCHDSGELYDYFSGSIPGIAARLKIMVQIV